jgi:hypothetical protein
LPVLGLLQSHLSCHLHHGLFMHAMRFLFVSASGPEVEFHFKMSRVSDEMSRVSDEMSRVSDEMSRVSDEMSRVSTHDKNSRLDMSDSFHDRERGFEAKFQLDEEQRFRAQARRDKLFGLWVAGQLGRADAETYAAEVVASNFEKPGDEDMLGKVRGDIKTAGKQIAEAVLQAELGKAMTEAVRQITAAK